MPTISTFNGITITMYYEDHGEPHFHARYAGTQAKYAIGSGRRIAGRLAGPIEALVLQWAALHQQELLANWDRALRGLPTVKIPGL